MSSAIRVEDISKVYRLGVVGTSTLRDDFARFWAGVTGKEDPALKLARENNRTSKGDTEYVWALKDVNFELMHGDVMGIVGKNGAGKSTLLKILSKVTAPTKGTLRMNGRIASLLEVGTGFHPELSGRENIYLNGHILGMTRREIDSKFDEIVDFAGIERYLDTPVKRYSSGMYVRLAFAVAAHLEPEILIVDEVLAVGDAEFQKKCLGKMKDVSNKQGRTILFVSHNMDAISRLCNKCMYMKYGTVQSIGSTDSIIHQYISNETTTESQVSYEHTDKAPGNELVRLLRAEVVDVNGVGKMNFYIDELIGVKVTFEVLKETNDLLCGFNLYTQTDLHIFSSHDTENASKHYSPGMYSTVVWMPQNFLSEGIHYCGIAAMSYKPFSVHFHDINTIGFNVIDRQDSDTVRGTYAGIFPGVIRPKLVWDIPKNIS
jgi:lipopolysaccharide transport system ATP-binding protein